MIDVLKEERVDTALLGELVTHPDFMKLLADISIYVNGIAAMQIHNLNAWVEVVRSKIIKEYQPGEQDMDALLSDAVLLRERDYFTSRVHEDIDAVMEDIGSISFVPKRLSASPPLSRLFLIGAPVRKTEQMVDVGLDSHGLPHIPLGLPILGIEGLFPVRQLPPLFFQRVHFGELFTA